MKREAGRDHPGEKGDCPLFPPQRWIFPAVLLISAAAIGYEILLMRLLSIVQWHHFAYMILSLALSGYGASGTFIALGRTALSRRFPLAFSLSALAFAVTMIASFIVGQRVPFNALEIVWNPRQFLHLATVYLVFFVPFFFAATCIGLALTCARTLINRIYFVDLFGAGLGALAIILALFQLSPQNALKVLAGLALSASILPALAPPPNLRLLPLQMLALAALLLAPAHTWLEFRMSPYKGLRQALEVIDTRVVGRYSSPLGLLTVVDSPSVPFRHAPGLSLATIFEPAQQLALFTDGDGMSVLTRFDGDDRALGYMDDMTQTLPYRLLDEPRVLVLGAGGGTDVLFALHHGARSVDAVELNPQTVKIVGDVFADFTGHIYDDPRVRVHVAEARGFVARSDQQFDLVQVSLLDSFAASGSGVQSLSESYLYTVEAMQEYLQRLAPGGFLAITRWIKLPPRDNLKLVGMIRQALERMGVAEPGKRLAIIRSWNTSTLLVKNGDISPADIETIRDFAQSRSFDTAWYPSMPRHEANRFNLLPEPYLYDGILSLLGGNPESFVDRYKFHIAPATDDRPYFFHFFKWSAFQEMLGLRAQGGAGLIEWGYLILAGTLLQATILGAVLILLPLSMIRPNWTRGTGRRMGAYFFLLGLAFLFVEMAFIQKFILFLSHPLYAIAVVLCGFLVFAGLGSACSARVARRLGTLEYSTIAPIVAGIVGLALAYLALLPILFARFAGLPDAAKIGISLMLIAPLAMLMGMPFPMGLARVGRDSPGFVPWAWGINGFASVVSASLATLLAIEFGFSAVIVLALLLYTGAAFVFRAWPDVTRENHHA
ncbi:MAG TPA: spermidine synthase [Woeseiaceae bacterium]|nr:spermidine synthase [Woeseiaceae bacterium]